MERSALVALPSSLKMTKAWPRMRRLRDTRMSRICPNCEKMAYSDFFSSAGGITGLFRGLRDYLGVLGDYLGD